MDALIYKVVIYPSHEEQFQASKDFYDIIFIYVYD